MIEWGDVPRTTKAYLDEYHRLRTERLARERVVIDEIIQSARHIDLRAAYGMAAAKENTTDAKSETRKAKRKAKRRQQRIARAEKDPKTVPGIETIAADPCAYCGEPAYTFDHIEPVYRGGSHSLDNLTRACWPCNRAKNTQPLLLWLARRARAAA